MVQYVLNRGDKFTTGAQYVANTMQKLTQKKFSIRIANYGIDVENIPVQKENIIYSNRLHNPLYRIDKIIIAFSKFLPQNPEWKLKIAATGSETENLKQLCKTLLIESNVEFLGWLDAKNNAENYAKSKIWVSIPLSDCTAISLLEAINLGCVPVVSNLPSSREWIEDDVNGVIVKDIDGEFLSKALVLNWDRVAEINKKIVEQRGTKEVNRKIFYEIYDEIFNFNNQ
jgi:glycosyltransferase involved in cell wall biosynthesis